VVFLKSPGRIGLAEGGTLNESSESDSAHAHCTLDTYCSLLTVQGYMQNFQQVRAALDFDSFSSESFRIATATRRSTVMIFL
jgi:hypothetical protein